MFEYLYKENFVKIDCYCAPFKWGHANWLQAKLEEKKVNLGMMLGPNHQDVDNHQIRASRLSSDIQLHKRTEDTSWGTSVWSRRKEAREEKKKKEERKKNQDKRRRQTGVFWRLSFCLK